MEPIQISISVSSSEINKKTETERVFKIELPTNGVNVKYFLKSRIKPAPTIHVTIKQLFRGFYRNRKLANLN